VGPARRAALTPRSPAPRQAPPDILAAALAAAARPARGWRGRGGGGGLTALEDLERRCGADYTLAVHLVGLRWLGRVNPAARAGPGGRVYGWQRLGEFPPACTDAAPLVGGGELTAWGGGRAEYRVRCTAAGDAGLLRGTLDVAVVDDAPAPPDDDPPAREAAGGAGRLAAGGGGWEGLCLGTCSVALAALVSRRGVEGQAPLVDGDGVHCGYVELRIEWLPGQQSQQGQQSQHGPLSGQPPPLHPPAPPPAPPVDAAPAARPEEERARRGAGGAGGLMEDDDGDGAP
jgi:hypothetical protein